NDAFASLLQKGPTEEALTHASTLYRLRRDWGMWLTPSIDAALAKFESALQEIAANAHFIEMALDHPARPAHVEEMFTTFAEVMGMATWQDKPVPPERASRAVLQKLREILGIEELTRLRDSLIKSALQ